MAKRHRFVALAVTAAVAAALSLIVVAVIDQDRAVVPDLVPVALPPPAIPETPAEEYRPSPGQREELKPNELWVMDLPSGEEMQIRFAAPTAPGAIVYVDIAKGSRTGIQKIADFCNRARGEWNVDIIGAARRVGIAITDAAAAQAFCTAMTSSIAPAAPVPASVKAGAPATAGKRP